MGKWSKQVRFWHSEYFKENYCSWLWSIVIILSIVGCAYWLGLCFNENKDLVYLIATIMIGIFTPAFTISEYRKYKSEFQLKEVHSEDIGQLRKDHGEDIGQLRKDHGEDIGQLKEIYDSKLKAQKIAFDNNKIVFLGSYLMEIADRLGNQETNMKFGSDERICVYRYFSKERGFRCIGRYSVDPELNKFVDNKFYREGFISNVFKKTDWVEAIIPSIPHDNRMRIERWKRTGRIDHIKEEDKVFLKRYQAYIKEEHGLTPDVYEKFRMNAEHMIAKKLQDKTAIGVIVFESCRKDFLSLECIKKACTKNNEQFIIRMICDHFHE